MSIFQLYDYITLTCNPSQTPTADEITTFRNLIATLVRTCFEPSKFVGSTTGAHRCSKDKLIQASSALKLLQCALARIPHVFFVVYDSANEAEEDVTEDGLGESGGSGRDLGGGGDQAKAEFGDCRMDVDVSDRQDFNSGKSRVVDVKGKAPSKLADDEQWDAWNARPASLNTTPRHARPQSNNSARKSKMAEQWPSQAEFINNAPQTKGNATNASLLKRTNNKAAVGGETASFIERKQQQQKDQEKAPSLIWAKDDEPFDIWLLNSLLRLLANNNYASLHVPIVTIIEGILELVREHDLWSSDALSYENQGNGQPSLPTRTISSLSTSSSTMSLVIEKQQSELDSADGREMDKGESDGKRNGPKSDGNDSKQQGASGLGNESNQENVRFHHILKDLISALETLQSVVQQRPYLQFTPTYPSSTFGSANQFPVTIKVIGVHPIPTDSLGRTDTAPTAADVQHDPPSSHLTLHSPSEAVILRRNLYLVLRRILNPSSPLFLVPRSECECTRLGGGEGVDRKRAEQRDTNWSGTTLAMGVDGMGGSAAGFADSRFDTPNRWEADRKRTSSSTSLLDIYASRNGKKVPNKDGETSGGEDDEDEADDSFVAFYTPLPDVFGIPVFAIIIHFPGVSNERVYFCECLLLTLELLKTNGSWSLTGSTPIPDPLQQRFLHTLMVGLRHMIQVRCEKQKKQQRHGEFSPKTVVGGDGGAPVGAVAALEEEIHAAFACVLGAVLPQGPVMDERYFRCGPTGDLPSIKINTDTPQATSNERNGQGTGFEGTAAAEPSTSTSPVSGGGIEDSNGSLSDEEPLSTDYDEHPFPCMWRALCLAFADGLRPEVNVDNDGDDNSSSRIGVVKTVSGGWTPPPASRFPSDGILYGAADAFQSDSPSEETPGGQKSSEPLDKNARGFSILLSPTPQAAKKPPTSSGAPFSTRPVNSESNTAAGGSGQAASSSRRPMHNYAPTLHNVWVRTVLSILGRGNSMVTVTNPTRASGAFGGGRGAGAGRMGTGMFGTTAARSATGTRNTAGSSVFARVVADVVAGSLREGFGMIRNVGLQVALLALYGMHLRSLPPDVRIEWSGVQVPQQTSMDTTAADSHHQPSSPTSSAAQALLTLLMEYAQHPALHNFAVWCLRMVVNLDETFEEGCVCEGREGKEKEKGRAGDGVELRAGNVGVGLDAWTSGGVKAVESAETGPKRGLKRSAADVQGSSSTVESLPK
ncbi:hypothetical protein HK102_005878, partial [Quaeritorhiza haematococci]